MQTEAFLDRLENVRSSGSGYMARCPAHEDSSASLSITEGEDKILVHCHAGCATPHVLETLGLGMHDLFLTQAAERKAVTSGAIEKTYTYTDAEGTPVFEVVRFAGKKFSQRIAGSSEWGLKGLQTKPLYRLPEVLEAIEAGRRVWIAEGEKDVDRIYQAGGVATCSVGGAGKWTDNYAHMLRGAKHVRIIADKDEAGIGHAEMVAGSLVGIPHDVVQAAEGKDAFDHLEAGLTLEQFVEMPKSYHGVALYRADMVEKTAVTWVPGWEGYIPMGGISHCAGFPGLNKSTLSCRVASDVTRLLGRGVLMVTSEDSVDNVVVPRLAAAGADLSKIHFPRKHITLPHDIEGLAAHVEEADIGLIVIDPVEAHLDNSIDSHRNASIRGALAPLAMLASAHNCAVLLIGHPNKGTSRDPMMRVSGSIGIPGIARSAMIMGNHPDSDISVGLRVVIAYKGNWAMKPQGKLFMVEPAPELDSIRLQYQGTTNIPVQMLLRGHTVTTMEGEGQS